LLDDRGNNDGENCVCGGMGDQEPVSFDEYVVARSPALLRFGAALTGDAHLAEDLVQQALVKAHRHWRTVSGADHPDAYVRRVMVTTHISANRRRRVLETLTSILPERAHSTDLAESVGERDQLDRAIKELAPRQRAVLVLRHYAGYEDSAIAAVLGCSETSVRAYASKGAARLRTLLTDDPSTHLQGSGT
jgi:RNA polymerase sigma-70 factor (sigma-E family)